MSGLYLWCRLVYSFVGQVTKIDYFTELVYVDIW